MPASAWPAPAGGYQGPLHTGDRCLDHEYCLTDLEEGSPEPDLFGVGGWEVFRSGRE